jgi:hypothetical protein
MRTSTITRIKTAAWLPGSGPLARRGPGHHAGIRHDHSGRSGPVVLPGAGRWVAAVTVLARGSPRWTPRSSPLPRWPSAVSSMSASVPLQWTMSGYTLTLAAFLLLGDRLGRRRAYLIGVPHRRHVRVHPGPALGWTSPAVVTMAWHGRDNPRLPCRPRQHHRAGRARMRRQRKRRPNLRYTPTPASSSATILASVHPGRFPHNRRPPDGPATAVGLAPPRSRPPAPPQLWQSPAVIATVTRRDHSTERHSPVGPLKSHGYAGPSAAAGAQSRTDAQNDPICFASTMDIGDRRGVQIGRDDARRPRPAIVTLRDWYSGA